MKRNKYWDNKTLWNLIILSIGGIYVRNIVKVFPDTMG